MYGIIHPTLGRIGTVMSVRGERPKTRWQAYASGDRRKGFPTKRDATAWLVDQAEAEAAEREKELAP